MIPPSCPADRSSAIPLVTICAKMGCRSHRIRYSRCLSGQEPPNIFVFIQTISSMSAFFRRRPAVDSCISLFSPPFRAYSLEIHMQKIAPCKLETTNLPFKGAISFVHAYTMDQVYLPTDLEDDFPYNFSFDS